MAWWPYSEHDGSNRQLLPFAEEMVARYAK
jgi:hypothetical protein